MSAALTIGVLSLQGGVAEHLAALARVDGVRGVPVSKASELGSVDAIILPGGESTAIGRLLRDFGMADPLRERIAAGLPAWGTCAGMILLAKDIDNDDRRHVGLMDISVRRNAYGGQLSSFDASAVIDGLGERPFPLVFIRAPVITRTGPAVEVLASLDGRAIACVQGAMAATSFHPELTRDERFHRWFAALARREA
ncbi:MAG: pyridoxal 5'-phosphate synthase glutaminase subunit PdxT [Spirochaetes bacterium]|nr:pyridoxal 5'-phosphate synthase glutaminase subunit PdxT [Spirochaetota bacterium]MBU1081031.1 pyridoxal 5'-phosphate synthase glutaminase subunit PdxT [Spirochaetota bacterium]